MPSSWCPTLDRVQPSVHMRWPSSARAPTALATASPSWQRTSDSTKRDMSISPRASSASTWANSADGGSDGTSAAARR